MAVLQHFREVGAHSNQETRPCDSSSPRPTVAPDSQPPPIRRKRKARTYSSEHQDTQFESFNHPQLQAKRQRTSSFPSSNPSTSSSSTDSSWSSWDRTERSYWDSLSQLRLTSSALRELNRRHALLRTKPSSTRDVTHKREQHPKDITRFARRGGPDLSDVRKVCFLHYTEKIIALTTSKHPNPEGVSSTPGSMPRNGKGKAKPGPKAHSRGEVKQKRSSAYDGNFEQHLIDNNIFLTDRSQRAANHQEWDEVLIQPRASPSRSSDRSFKSFKKAVVGAQDEDEVMSKAFPKIVGNSRHPSGQNVPFGNLEQITKKIVVPQPDWYQGELPGEGNRTLRERLNKAIVPSNRKERPFLPTYFAEAKGPDGSYTVARRQACHDGALGARVMHSLQSLGGTEDYDGKAYAASAIYHGEGDLKLFTHHMTQPRGPGTLPHTHMNRIKALNLTDSPQSFREGRVAFRNVADKTSEYRVQFINDANRRNGIVSPPPPTITHRSPRRPLSCQAPAVESSDSDPSSSSEEEESDSGNHAEPSRTRPKGKMLKPNLVAATPKRLARRSPSPRPMTRRRRAVVSSGSDASSSSEEETSRAPQRPQLSKAKVLTATPKRLARRDPSPPRRELRPRRASRRL